MPPTEGRRVNTDPQGIELRETTPATSPEEADRLLKEAQNREFEFAQNLNRKISSPPKKLL